MAEEIEIKNTPVDYGDEHIIHLDDMEHIRRRPGMYIGKLGDGSHSDDGIYVLIKESIDNSIDEFRMGEGKVIEVEVTEGRVRVRDYGRGIPLGKLIEVVSVLNTGGKYDSKAFKKSVGLNGVGTKAVNALSSYFSVQSFREGKTRKAEFSQGKLTSDSGIIDYTGNEKRGTIIEFVPDDWGIPLIIAGCDTTLRYDPVIGQVDVFPTLLDVMGANAYPWKGLGHSILRYPVSGAIQPRNMSVIGDSTALTLHQRRAWDISRLLIFDAGHWEP